MQSIFISSSGDLADLRKGLSEDLRGWLEENGFAHIVKPYLWEEDKENGRLLSDRQGIQNQLPDPASYDVPLTICLFGERCGSRLSDELDPLVDRRFDSWRSKGDGPGLLHPWPNDLKAQDQALARGQYPLTGTVYELISAHAHPVEAENLIVACCVDHPIAPEISVERVVLNGRKLHDRLIAGRSDIETQRIEADIYKPQARALWNFLTDIARKKRFVTSYSSEEIMRREVFAIAQKKLSEKLGIASLRNPFKQSLDHWTVDDEKPLPGRSDVIKKIVEAMGNHGDIVLLKGRSGCGKSSLMQSGVMRRLREIDGSIPIPFRPTELMAGSGKGDELERLAHLIAETAGVPFDAGGPKAKRPENYAKRLKSALEGRHINVVIGLDQFEEIIDELKLERQLAEGKPQNGWWGVIYFLKELCGSPSIRLVATLESAREKSFHDLHISKEIGLMPKTMNVDATEDTIAEIAKNGFSRGGLPLDPAVLEVLKNKWTKFEEGTHGSNIASPLPLACLFLQRLYERFADQAGATVDERLESAFQQAGSCKDDHLLTLEEIGGEDEIAFAEIIQNLADAAWIASDGAQKFSDPIEKDKNFIGLNSLLTPLIWIDRDGFIQLRAVVESDGDEPVRRRRREFRVRRLLVPVQGGRVRPVHQALIDRWSPASRWFAYRKQVLQVVQCFREAAIFYHNNGKSMPLEADGSTLRAAAMTLCDHILSWAMCKSGTLGCDETAIRNQALDVFDTAEDPFTLIEGSLTQKTYAHLAADYHRVDLLRRFVSVNPECLKVEDTRGENLLHRAAWCSGPAVPYLIELGVPLMTEKSMWNAIAMTISESLNDNFDAMISHLSPDDPIETMWKVRMLHFAAQRGNMYVIEYLTKQGATLDIKNDREQTALHYTTKYDQAEAFRYLFPHIDIHTEDNWKNTAISNAARDGATKVLTAYLTEEADVDRLIAVLHHRNDQGDTPLMIAARYWQPETLRILLQQDLGDLGDPSSEVHFGENGDTVFHRVFRGANDAPPSDEDRFRARTVIEILLQDGRLNPNLLNAKGETPFDLGGAFPEARRVLRQDDRVPKNYDVMTSAMRIEDLSSRRPATVLRLLEDAPQALTDRHQQTSKHATDSARLKGKLPTSSKMPDDETGLDILIRLKNYAVLAALTEDPKHWPTLLGEFDKLLTVAKVPAAGRLREVLLHRFAEGEIVQNLAGKLLGVCVDANDVKTASALAKLGATLTLSRNEQGQTALHHAAIVGDVEQFRSILTIGAFTLPRDNWGRRPSDLASEVMSGTFRKLEANMDDQTQIKNSLVASLAINGQPPFLGLERDRDVCEMEEPELAVLQREWSAEWGNLDDFDTRVFDLPFHPNVPLIEIRRKKSSIATGRLCFLLQKEKLFRLNGTSPPIHNVNGDEMPLIDEQTVLHYLAFFCFFVRGDEGPFMIVDSLEHSFLPNLGEQIGEIKKSFRPPRVWGKDENGNCLVSGIVYYANALFFADFCVQPRGMIEMIDDTPLVGNLPSRIDAPLDIRSLH